MNLKRSRESDCERLLVAPLGIRRPRPSKAVVNCRSVNNSHTDRAFPRKAYVFEQINAASYRRSRRQ